jgi:hypothetical protein
MLSNFIKIEDKDQKAKFMNQFSMIDSFRFMSWFDFRQNVSFAIRIKNFNKENWGHEKRLKINFIIKDGIFEKQYKNGELI